jgi:hypothetical protein
MDPGRKKKNLRVGIALAAIVLIYIGALIGYMIIR